ncbi:hypothetical protein [Rathayibacter festucae]|uniref:hypothetical protein n=1 Tax=Rathayibacter festucae TaxID=110937 RepID=UPI002A69B7C8|nr:hypothetical protein [Rathayibacter festucae]MDY0914745.1 hypothetical protein [Rathayibacter festucae]
MGRRGRALTGAAVLLAIAVVATATGPAEGLELALSADDCVESARAEWRPVLPLARDEPAVFDVDVIARDDCPTDRLVALAATASEAIDAALRTAPAGQRSSELVLRAGDDVLSIADPRERSAPVGAWDALRRGIDGSLSVRTVESYPVLAITLAPTSAANALDALDLLLEQRSAITGGDPDWTIEQPATDTRGAASIRVQEERPADEIVRLAHEIDGAFSGVRESTVHLNGTVLSVALTGAPGTAVPRSLRDTVLWPRVLGTMTALTDRGSGYAIGAEIAAEAVDGSGPVVDSFTSSTLQCAATPGAGATTQAAFEHLRTSIRPAHPGESFAFNGLTAPACR